MENIKSVTAKMLIESGVKELPIDVMHISLPDIKWVIKPFSEVSEIISSYEELGLLECPKNQDGFATKSVNGTHYIFYNDKLGYAERNEVIAHEIGHIVLGHTSVGLILGKSDNPDIEDMQEKEAIAFSAYLLAPTCVLVNAGITKPYLIEKVTTISQNGVKEVLYDIINLKSYTRTPEEAELCKQFSRFIRRQRKQTPKKNGFNVIAAICGGLLIFAADTL